MGTCEFSHLGLTRKQQLNFFCSARIKSMSVLDSFGLIEPYYTLESIKNSFNTIYLVSSNEEKFVLKIVNLSNEQFNQIVNFELIRGC